MRRFYVLFFCLMSFVCCTKSPQPQSKDPDPDPVFPVSMVQFNSSVRQGDTLIVNGKGFKNGCTLELNGATKVNLTGLKVIIGGVSAIVPETAPVGAYKLILNQDGNWELGSISVEEALPEPDPGQDDPDPGQDDPDPGQDDPETPDLSSRDLKLSGLKKYEDGELVRNITVSWDADGRISRVNDNGNVWFEYSEEEGLLKAVGRQDFFSHYPAADIYEYSLENGCIRTETQYINDKVTGRFHWNYDDGFLVEISNDNELALNYNRIIWNEGQIVGVDENTEMFTYDGAREINDDNIELSLTVNEFLGVDNAGFDESIVIASWMGLCGKRSSLAPSAFLPYGNSLPLVYEKDDRWLVKAVSVSIDGVANRLEFEYE